jgi:NADH:ubiquinone oxidoreductase subunit
LHYTVDETPEEAGFEKKDWHQPHRANQTGTPNAHRPAGQDDAASHRAGYGSWSPE